MDPPPERLFGKVDLSAPGNRADVPVQGRVPDDYRGADPDGQQCAVGATRHLASILGAGLELPRQSANALARLRRMGHLRGQGWPEPCILNVAL